MDKKRLHQPKLKKQQSRSKAVDSDYRALLGYAFNLLARKWYTEHELVIKLVLRCTASPAKAGRSSFLIEQVLQRLRELNYINDDRILENYLSFTLPARPLGKFGFLQKMRQRGIDYAQAELAWNTMNLDEEVLAHQLVENRLKRLSSSTKGSKKEQLLAQRKKLANFLAGRGFSPSVIYEVVDGLFTFD